MTTSGIVMLILLCLLAISAAINFWLICCVERMETYYEDWIAEIERKRKW